METTKFQAKTLEEALQAACQSFSCALDQLDYSVLEEGSKGILGFGAKPFVIEAQPKQIDLTELVKTFIRTILNQMELLAELRVKQLDPGMIEVNLAGPKMGLIIGYRGETLDALQYLTNLYINKERGSRPYVRVVIDTEGYREKREETLRRLAEKTAWKVKKYGKSIALDPMNSNERRIIHTRLQGDPNVQTHSEGVDPYRKVVVEPQE
ncbi:RNA-binding protein Jag [Clostridiaceae bacterium JG1575]|nr:RNA-binding protein Jag [Clostridiaceae bacterium JG1575]